MPHFYVMEFVDRDRGNDLPHREVELVGCASIQKLKPNNPATVVLRKGMCFPGTRAPLQVDNYGSQVLDIKHDWDYVLKYIAEHAPPDLNRYPNP